MIRTLDEVCDQYKETLATILANSCLFPSKREEIHSGRDIVSEVVDLVVAENGPKSLSQLMSNETLKSYLQSFRVPDWVLLYFKLESKVPDDRWQTLLNLTKLGVGKVRLYYEIHVGG